MAEESEDALVRAKDIVALREEYRDALQDMHATALTLRLLDALFINPYTTIPRAQTILGATHPPAQKAIEKYLVPAGILEEIPSERRPKKFRASAILAALDV